MSSTSTCPLPTCESLTVEFKSDRNRLTDSDIVDAAVCLANAEGGELWLGVEDDGSVTGLHPSRDLLDGLSGLIASRTSPPLSVTTEEIHIDDKTVVRIFVRRGGSEVSTLRGKYLRRRIGHDGKPECVPMLPNDRASYATRFGLSDASSLPVEGATMADLDPIERERLRQSVERHGGDRVLLDLEDHALDGALGLTTSTTGMVLPTLTGLLMIGKVDSLRRLVPTHEFAFQVLAQEAVSYNEFRNYPLIKALEWLELNFRPYNPEREIQIDLFRVPVPKVDLAAFREAVANALIHRDYHKIGAVHIRLDDSGLTLSNPGGLVEGVTLANLLTTEPRPRNRTLADAMKRVGLAERSGRGVDAIYRGMLRFGRSEPDYSGTTSDQVVLRLPTGEADAGFLRFVVEQEEERGGRLPIDGLIALSALREERRLTPDELSQRIHRDAASAKRTLEGLLESGLVQAHGSTPRTRSYTLSANVYAAIGQKAAFTRQAGFLAIQNEQMILNYVRQHGQIRRSEVVGLCGLTDAQAKLMLKKLRDEDCLRQMGTRRAAYYILG